MRKRMFGGLDDVAAADIAFDQKEPRLVWRGATTGLAHPTPGLADASPRFNVPLALRRAQNRAFDLGFSEITLPVRDDAAVARRVRPHLKPRLPIAEQLRARYLLCLEGNDTASGLRWMLASNSTVVMPRPTVTGFACEGLLEPMTHYVPVRPDLSDLNSVFDWCLGNDDACRRIADNGRRFMAAFGDPGADEELSLRLVAEYFARVGLRAAPGAELPSGVL